MKQNFFFSAILVAGGIGKRIKSEIPKQFLFIDKFRIIHYTVLNFFHANFFNEIILVYPEKFYYLTLKSLKEISLINRIKLTKGGNSRQQSVFNGLKMVEKRSDFVFIHDVARPFTKLDLLKKLKDEVIKYDSVSPGIKIFYTLKKIDKSNMVITTVDREKLIRIQTPQAFRTSLIVEAHNFAVKKGWNVTDDTSLLELMGFRTKIIEGDLLNFKITVDLDVKFAEFILKEKLYVPYWFGNRCA